MAHYRTRRSGTISVNPFIGFLLVASFGILFAGCGGETSEIPQADEFTFTADDLAKVKELVGEEASWSLGNEGSGSFVPRLGLSPELEGENMPPVINTQEVSQYEAIRSGSSDGENFFRVTNEFLNVRATPNVTSEQLGRLEQGEVVSVIEFINAAWAKVSFGTQEGYVSARYISKPVSEAELAQEKKKYEGLYFVDFGFLNVRKSADSDSEKIGELPGQSFIKPVSMDEVWARIPFEGGDGYVAVQYLTPFLPNFLVRQSTYNVPVIHYRLASEGIMSAMGGHLDALKKAGYRIQTLSDFADLLMQQERRDTRLDPKTVLLTIADITPDNVREVSDLLRLSGVQATLFIQTKHLGPEAIDQQQLLTLLANGHDLQSGGHTGDDLRSLTNAQVELELSQSKKLLEDATHRDVFAIGYPLGGVNDRVEAKAGAIGYLLGVSTSADSTFERSELLRMPSVVPVAATTSEELLQKVTRQ